MEIIQAQQNMKFAYFGGATGVLVSGLIWLIAGSIALMYSNQLSMLALFIGGMFIHPLAMLLSKLFKRPGNHDAKNPLGVLALESTVILFVGLFLAFYVANLQVALFYPIMLLAIGVRYLIFNTVYGSKIYWLLGLILIISGVLCILLKADFALGAFVGGVIEVIFSFIILVQTKDEGIEIVDVE